MEAKIILIIKRLIDNKPLKPSIRFAPLIINKKHIDEAINILNKTFKNIK